MEKKSNKIIFTILLLILSGILLLILVEKRSNIGIIWRFIFSASIGVICGIFIYKYWGGICRISTIFTIEIFLSIASLFFTIIFMKYGDTNGFENPYKNIERFDVGNQFQDMNENYHCTIFVLDKTMKTTYTPKFPSNLENLYDLYIDKIKNDPAGYSDFPKKEGKDISYIDFCSAKLCYDLINFYHKGVSESFTIYTIDNYAQLLLPATKTNNIDTYELKKIIIDLSKDTIAIDNNVETDFGDFYDKFFPILDEEKHIFVFNKYTLDFYSDFVFDKIKKNNYNSDRFDVDFNKIKNIQKEISNESIIQNLYLVPSNSNKFNNPFCKLILPEEEKNSFYLNIINLTYEDLSKRKDYDYYHKIKQPELSIPIYAHFLSKTWRNILYFPNKNFEIKLLNKNNLQEANEQEISINGSIKLRQDKFQSIEQDSCSISYTGSQNTKIYLDIANKNGTHVFINFEFHTIQFQLNKYLIPISFFVTLFFFYICIRTTIYRVKKEMN